MYAYCYRPWVIWMKCIPCFIVRAANSWWWRSTSSVYIRSFVLSGLPLCWSRRSQDVSTWRGSSKLSTLPGWCCLNPLLYAGREHQTMWAGIDGGILCLSRLQLFTLLAFLTSRIGLRWYYFDSNAYSVCHRVCGFCCNWLYHKDGIVIHFVVIWMGCYWQIIY